MGQKKIIQKRQRERTKAEATKVAKYAALASTHVFVPLVFKTLGAWGEQARVFAVQLGRLITGVTGDVRETDFLRQRLSLQFSGAMR